MEPQASSAKCTSQGPYLVCPRLSYIISPPPSTIHSPLSSVCLFHRSWYSVINDYVGKIPLGHKQSSPLNEFIYLQKLSSNSLLSVGIQWIHPQVITDSLPLPFTVNNLKFRQWLLSCTFSVILWIPSVSKVFSGLFGR